MKMSRVWCMPNKNTFEIKPIRELIGEYIGKVKSKNPNAIIIDPFANRSKLADVTNDLNPEFNTDYNMEALDFLKIFDDKSVDMVLYDPVYSPRQLSECYRKLGKSVTMKTTQSSYWSNHKKEISRIVKKEGIVITCSWNSGGMGKNNGFEIIEILLTAHGGWHNDTILVVEQKKI